MYISGTARHTRAVRIAVIVELRKNEQQWTMYNNSNKQCIVHNEQCTTIKMHNIYNNNAQWQQ